MRERRSIQSGSIQGCSVQVGSVRAGRIQRFSNVRIHIVLSMFNRDTFNGGMFNRGTAQPHRHHIRTQQKHTA